MTVFVLAACSCFAAKSETPEKSGIPKAVQEKAALATVRVINRKRGQVGSGVILANAKGVAYVLTAGHLTDQADTLEVRVFDKGVKNPCVYEAVQVVARRREHNQDLALLRIANYRSAAAGLEVGALAAVAKQKSFRALATSGVAAAHS